MYLVQWVAFPDRHLHGRTAHWLADINKLSHVPGVNSTLVWLTCTAYDVVHDRLEIRVLVLQMVPWGHKDMLIPNLGSEVASGVRDRPLGW